jgi:acyl CoA:acetate/3-ketoacid CoA transferase alpha subunit
MKTQATVLLQVASKSLASLRDGQSIIVGVDRTTIVPEYAVASLISDGWEMAP